MYNNGIWMPGHQEAGIRETIDMVMGYTSFPQPITIQHLDFAAIPRESLYFRTSGGNSMEWDPYAFMTRELCFYFLKDRIYAFSAADSWSDFKGFFISNGLVATERIDAGTIKVAFTKKAFELADLAIMEYQRQHFPSLNLPEEKISYDKTYTLL